MQIKNSSIPFGMLVPIIIFGGCFLIMIVSAFSEFLFHFDFFPASGSAYGYIFYQEKSGIYQLDWVCWKDTQYEEYCEVFDPGGEQFSPGKYKIDYECTTFVWAWEDPSVCRITNATKLGELPGY